MGRSSGMEVLGEIDEDAEVEITRSYGPPQLHRRLGRPNH
jgi:hypothetical protein